MDQQLASGRTYCTGRAAAPFEHLVKGVFASESPHDQRFFTLGLLHKALYQHRTQPVPLMRRLEWLSKRSVLVMVHHSFRPAPLMAAS